MKEQLWILNSSLLLLFVATLLIGVFYQQKAPRFRLKRVRVEIPIEEKELKNEEIENIYKYDLFGTFVKREFTPEVKTLVSPIPEPKPVSIPKPPEPMKIEFTEPLKITLKGIAYSSDESKSVTIIADENKSEDVYHCGDMIKDAQIIKIAQNRIVLLRSNGQHESIFLRKDDIKEKQEENKNWDGIVRKIEENSFEIDLLRFPSRIDSIGQLVEQLSLLTIYSEGNPVGLKISKIDPEGIGPHLGLKENDIIKSINKISVSKAKSRVEIHDKITKLKKGDPIELLLSRDNNDINIKYTLADIKFDKKRTFKKTEKDKAKKKDLFKLNRLQEREKIRRSFREKHKKEKKQKNMIEEIRKRLLENIRSRVRNTRIR